MANVESHGFNRLIGDLTRRSVDRDSADDMLFHDRGDAPRRLRTNRALEVVLPSFSDDTHALTLRVRRNDDRRMQIIKIALPLGLLVVLGVLIGLAIHDGGKNKADDGAVPAAIAEAAMPTAAAAATTPSSPAPTTTAPTSPASPPTAPAPVASPAPTAPSTTPRTATAPTASSSPASPTTTNSPATASPAPAARFVEVRIESTPPGANVTLVEDGKVSVLGHTPIDASVDPTHGYEVVFALAAHATKVEHLDPAKTLSVAVTLDAEKPARKAPTSRHRTRRH